MPRRGYQSITVKDSTHQKLEKISKHLEISIPILLDQLAEKYELS